MKRLVIGLVAVLVATTTPSPVGAAPTPTTTANKSTTTTAPPSAARQSAIDKQLRTLREQVEEASAEEAELLDRLDDVAARRRALDGQVRDIEAEIASTEAALAAASEQMGAVSADLNRAEAKFSATLDGLSGARDELVDRAVNAYIRQPTNQAAAVILERPNFRELAATRDFLRSFFQAQARSVERYQALRDDIDAERQSLGAAHDEVAASRALVAQHREALLQARARQATLRSAASAEEGRQKALLGDVRSRVKEFEAEIAALKKESDSIAALLRSRQAGQKLVPSGKGVLGTPVPGPITSGFGPRLHPILATMRMHTGVDFSATSGTPIKASADGVVVVAGERGGYGNTVILDHGNTLATLYAHQSRVAVADGARVTKGQTVGYVGSTGFSTGPHLHFEVRVNGNPVDPMRYL